MHFKYRLVLAIVATAALTVCRIHAQEDDEDDEEFSTMGFFGRSPQTLKVGVSLAQGAAVKFGNLGTVPSAAPEPSPGVVGRVYADGAVNRDAPRPYSPSDRQSEISSDGQYLSTPGQPYRVYDPNIRTQLIGDYLSYTPGLTRSWSYNNTSQATSDPGYIAYHTYSSNSEGASLNGSRQYSGSIDVTVSRDLTNPNKRVSFSLMAGMTLAGINSSTSGQVNSSLHVFTDLYSLNGLAAPVTSTVAEGAAPRFTGPSFMLVDGVDTETTGVDNTALTLSDLPDSSSSTDVPKGAVVKGLWKMKGAYFTLKFGPQLNAWITHSLALNASMGLAGSFVDTTYSATESFSVVGVGTDLTTGELTSNKSLFLPGYFARIDATWALNGRTGLFAGVSYDNLGNYDQSIGGRTAKIDLSATAGVRGGLSVKF